MIQVVLSQCLLLVFLFFLGSINGFAQIDDDLWEKANLCYNQKKYSESIDLFNAIIKDNPFYGNTYVQKSYAQYYLKDYDDAISTVDKAYCLKLIDSKYFYMKGQFFDKKGELDKALFYFDMLLKFDPNSCRYVNYRGNIHLELNNYKKAIADYDFVLAREPEKYELYFSRGAAKFNLKMKREACLDWLYAKDYNESCKRYFHYRCDNEDLRPVEYPKIPVQEIMMPEFEASGDSSLSNFLYFELQYPEEAFLNEIQGTVLVQYDITEKGLLENVKIVHSVHPLLDNEVIRVIKLTNDKWIKPGTRNNTPIRTSHVQPVTFAIVDLDIEESALLDSMNVCVKGQKYNDILRISEKILKRNPFNYEVFLQRQNAVSVLGFNDTLSYNSLYRTLRSSNVFISKEVAPYKKYLKLYYTCSGELTSRDKSQYYRIAQVNNSNFISGKYVDYYVDGGIFAIGQTNNKIKNGLFQFYYPNGKLQSEFLFEKDMPVGLMKFYYDDGSPQHLIENTSSGFRVVASYSKKGDALIKNGNGMWNYSVPVYNQVDSLKIKGGYNNNLRINMWELSLTSGFMLKEEYDNGRFISGYYIKNNEKINFNKSQISASLLVPGVVKRSFEMLMDSNLEGDLYKKLFEEYLIIVKRSGDGWVY